MPVSSLKFDLFPLQNRFSWGGAASLEMPANALLRLLFGNSGAGHDWRKDKNPLHSATLYNTVSERTVSYPWQFYYYIFHSTGRINATFIRSAPDRQESITLTSDTGNTALMNVILSSLFCTLENQLKYWIWGLFVEILIIC